MTTEIRAAYAPGEIRIAALTDGVLTDFAIWRPGRPDGVDDLYRGRVAAPAPALAGAFIDLGAETGFLPDSEAPSGLTQGDLVAVRVTRSAQAGKGPRLSARAIAAEPGPPGLIRRGPGNLREIAAMHPDATIFIDDIALLAELRPAFGARLALIPRSFSEGLESEIATLFEPRITLPNGAEIHIEPTRALIAIDLDSNLGAGNTPKTSAHLAANRALLPELVRQIRLRDLAGTILVDFAGLNPRKRALLRDPLAALLATDPRRPRLAGFTNLGLAEIVRARRHPPIFELSQGPHAAGLQALRQACRNPARQRLRAHPTIIAALESDPDALQAYAHRATYPLILQSDPALPPPGWALEEL